MRETSSCRSLTTSISEHNLSNLAGAKRICQLMGVEENDFYQAIENFKGASKRLEIISSSNSSVLLKDFAHAPSKVKATTAAVRKQFKGFKLVACLELHTYSSLDSEFINNYRDSLILSDLPIVFYDPEALKIKNRIPISEIDIINSFNDDRINVLTRPKELEYFLLNQDFNQTVLLMMSSGNFGGIIWDNLSKQFDLKV